jgi:hypothetical protein
MIENANVKQGSMKRIYKIVMFVECIFAFWKFIKH